MIDGRTDRKKSDGTPAEVSEGLALSTKQLIARANAAWEGNEYAAGLADFLEVLDRSPDFPDVRNRAGLCRAMLGDPEGALVDFTHAVYINPDYAEAHLNRCLVLNELGRFDEARDAFERVRALDTRPDDGFPAHLGNRIAVDHANLGDLYIEADRLEAGIAEYRKALEIRPSFVDIRTRLAKAYLAAEELDPALTELTRVLNGQASYLAARILLGMVLLRMGRKDEAVSEWRTCLEMDPENRRARAYLVSAGVRIEEM